jgi:hypothetical protein
MHRAFIHQGLCPPVSPWRAVILLLVVLFISILVGTGEALAHAVTQGDKGYIQEISGVNILPFVYLGALHAGVQARGAQAGSGRAGHRGCGQVAGRGGADAVQLGQGAARGPDQRR